MAAGKQDPAVYAAIARLNGNPDFEVFMEHCIEKPLEETIQVCIDSKTPERAQGAAQTYQGIQATVRGARETHEKLTSTHVPLGPNHKF